jgi:hypothetical protein
MKDKKKKRTDLPQRPSARLAGREEGPSSPIPPELDPVFSLPLLPTAPLQHAATPLLLFSDLPNELTVSEAPWEGVAAGYIESDDNGEQNFQGRESSLKGGSSSDDEDNIDGRSVEDFLEWPLELLLQSEELQACRKRKRRKAARITTSKHADRDEGERECRR